LGELPVRPNESWTSAVPRLAAAFGSIEHPAVLVLDDVHVLNDRDCLDVLGALRAVVPHGSQLMLAGRAEPQLGLARLRAERRVAELGTDDLAFSSIEAEALLSAAGVDVAGVDVAALTRQTEGWAAGLYLTALSLRESETGNTPRA
jgi:LuxR family transcriptional regulator, maltose regulon positive regulatory protein